ncbi:hypothetical protein AAVH_17401, partial [Aphelenchoides avenae]
MFELAALRARRNKLSDEIKDANEEIQRLQAERTRKESENMRILNREEHLREEMHRLHADSAPIQSEPGSNESTDSTPATPPASVDDATQAQLERIL